MQEQEKQRMVHLLILLVYSIATVVLAGEAILLGWDISAVVLLFIGVIVCWIMHIMNTISEEIRLWLYITLIMLEFFFYGIHETSIFDMAPLMIVIMILFSVTEKYSVVRYCMGTYYLTLLYDYIFVIDRNDALSSVAITRSVLHVLLVFVAGKLVRMEIQRRNDERKENEEKIAKLEEINGRTEDFLTNVSHELRTPINAVTGITTVMLNNEEDKKKRKDLMSIQTAGQRLFRQIGDILDYTELDTSRMILSEEPYMITSLINDIIVENRLSGRNRALEVVFDIDAKIPYVLLGDARKIKKILSHLIDNAYKFTQKGGIYIRVYALRKPYGINLCIQVSDTGIGMTPEEVKKIRTHFYQSNAGRSRQAGGLGLGLSIVYGMVSAMEGFLQIESTSGKGTTVSVSIPQKISDNTACMFVENKQNLCLACYLKPEKYEVPEIRHYYDQMIANLVEGIDIPLHRANNINDLKHLESLYQFTHLFLGKDEYEENGAYFEALSHQINLIVIADDTFSLPKSSGVKLMRKPFYSLPIVNMLGLGREQEDEVFKDKYMICPGVRVLVVDDEPMNLMVAKGVFRDYQMEVTTADSGRKAIEICRTQEFDLIFLDHMMPEMDGVETLKVLRKNNAELGVTCSVIAFTANAVSGAREMFLQEGFDEFLSKPIEVMAMERILRKVLPKSSIQYVDKHFHVADDEADDDGETEEKKDPVSLLEDFGIDTRLGISYCMDERFYIEMLNKFADDAPEKRKAIVDAYEGADWEKYAIFVHALKSTSKMVGILALSEKARDMETASKQRDIEYVKARHQLLLNEYQLVVDKINEVLKQAQDVKGGENV